MEHNHNTRDLLPQRRRSETYDFRWHSFEYVVTVGYYDDGRIGEVFITGGKSGQELGAVALDGAVVLSIALQHGTPLAVIAKAITRDQRGEPQSIVGAVIDRLVREATKGELG